MTTTVNIHEAKTHLSRLLAQVQVERLTFLTANRSLLALGYDWIDDALVVLRVTGRKR